MEKKERLDIIAEALEKELGFEKNIQGVAHCATRLRVVVEDLSDIRVDCLEAIDGVKGVFITGNQVQVIFGAGFVNDVYATFSKRVGKENMSLHEVKKQGAKHGNIVQTIIKSLSDVFVEIIPAILAAALLMGVTSVLGNWDFVVNNPTLYSINRLANLASTGIFAILPMAICYSSTKRYGGRAILGIVVGAIMLDGSLVNAYTIGTANFNPEILNLFGLQIPMVGFQGGIIIALMMGYVVAQLDCFFVKHIPDVIQLLVAPMLTVFISTVLLFTIVGPLGRGLGDVVTTSLLWMTENLGVFGYAAFAGLQQIIVISGLHHILGAVESQLIADTSRNFINPLMSVALIGQAGAVLGYMALHFRNTKTREICIPSFISTLFGISEPAIFGINLRYKFPLISGCIGGAVAGAYVYFTNLASLGFGTTALPGLAIVDPVNNGYVHYILAHCIGLSVGFIITLVYGKWLQNKQTQIIFPSEDTVAGMEESHDPTFASKTMGDGIVVESKSGRIVAPTNATVEFVFPTKHAIGLRLDNGASILIHAGINTVEAKGEGFEVLVSENQKVQTGELLMKMDKALLESKGYDCQVMFVVTEIPKSIICTIDATKKEWFSFN